MTTLFDVPERLQVDYKLAECTFWAKNNFFPVLVAELDG